MTDDRSYVYAVLVDGVVRYIGKGSGRRVLTHLVIAKRLARLRAQGLKIRASLFYNKLSKAFVLGSEITHVILTSELSQEDAYERERAEISAAPVGQLWNMWSGGLGSSFASPELRQKISDACKKRYEDPEQLSALKARIAAMWTPEVRAKASARQRSRFSDGAPDLKAWHAKAHTQTVYAKRGETLKKTYAAHPEIVAAAAAKSSAWWKDPNNNAAQRAKLSEAHARPEVKAKRRAYWDSPEGRANMKKAVEARWAKLRALKATA